MFRPIALLLLVCAAGCGTTEDGPADAGRDDSPASRSRDGRALGPDLWPTVDQGRDASTWPVDGTATHPDARQVIADAGVVGPDAAPKAVVQLQFSGCQPDFSGQLVVVHSGGVLAVAAVAAPARGSLQLDLKGHSGTLDISTAHRQQTGAVINLLSGGTTFTNITFDQRYYLGEVPDPIGGSLTVHQLQPSQGIAQLTFARVTLEDVGSGHAHCTIDGTLRTSGLSF